MKISLDRLTQLYEAHKANSESKAIYNLVKNTQGQLFADEHLQWELDVVAALEELVEVRKNEA